MPFPGTQFLIDKKGTAFKLKIRVWLVEMQQARDRAVFDLQNRLDESRGSRGYVQVADIALSSAERAEVLRFGRRAKGSAECGNLDGVAYRSSGAVSFDVADRVC